MVKERRRQLMSVFLRALRAVLPFLAVAGMPTAGLAAPISLTDAAQRGAFNVGAAQAVVGTAPNPAGGELLKLEYTMPRGTAAGVWTKAFPAGLRAGAVDLARLGVKSAEGEPIAGLAVVVEIKGSAGIQRIPVTVRPEWTYREVALDWPAVGEVSEIVVAVSRVGDDELAVGTLLVDVRFDQLGWVRSLSMHPAARIAGALLISLLGMLLARIFVPQNQPTIEPGWLGSLRGDFVGGVGTVALVGLAVAVYIVGGREKLEIGWTALGLAVAGAALAEWWTFGFAGRHLTPGEVFRAMFATGLMAACASPMAILQVPTEWPEVLLLSQTVAATTVLVYHAAVAMRASTSGRNVGATAGWLIVATPFAVSSLLLLGSPLLNAGPAVSAAVGHAAVAFGFNVAVANGLSLASRRTILRSGLAYLTLLSVAVAAVVAPLIADGGSSAALGGWPIPLRLMAVITTAMLSQAGLWAEVYLITGLLMDALQGRAPTDASIRRYPIQGATKGMIFSGIFMAVIQIPGWLGNVPQVRELVANDPAPALAILGALVFPLVKTVIESFDGSPNFFRRLMLSYRARILYVRGTVVGFGVGMAVTGALPQAPQATRALFGFAIGAGAFAGVNFLRDGRLTAGGSGRWQSWRVYLVHALLGGFVGAGLGFYFDAVQVKVVADKLARYLAIGAPPSRFEVYPLLSKWGHIDLGTVTGGVNLLFAESLSGVIEWSIPAWLFALNRNFLAAYFRKESAPITALFTRPGLIGLTENMLAVFRWGLWMSPIIKSFLRPMGDPTWYNQDGLICTVVATIQDIRLSPDAFRAWSLQVFIWRLAYDAVRVLIWLDHMGLRVATLVNLSFLGMDKLDGRLARFLSPAATARCIPESVKRFTTWAPLLIPYYIPRGPDWDTAWSQSETLQHTGDGGLFAHVAGLPAAGQLLLLAGAVAVSTTLFSTVRRLRGRFGLRDRPDYVIGNSTYEVVLNECGGAYSRVPGRGFDVSRRSYDAIDPAGRALFLVDAAGAWPVVGNAPGVTPWIEAADGALTVINTHDEILTSVVITLPAADDPVELWTVTIENASDVDRSIHVVPYLEWVLNRPDADRGHTQYNRLFAEMEYVSGLHAVLAWDKHGQAMGLLASDIAPDGFLTARVDFIGRARSLWSPRVLETLAFSQPVDTLAHPTFDPIASLKLSLTLPARGSNTVRLLIGMVDSKRQAIDLIDRHLAISGAASVASTRVRKVVHSIGHGEIPPNTPQPYAEFSDDGHRLDIATPFTPRPWDHTLANARGHVVAVTNRGLHTTSSVNAQQNRITPDWSDTVTREIPGEAFYLYDPDHRQWYSPTFHPLNDATAQYAVEFSIDGTATYRMTHCDISTELTVFVPPDEPAGLYLLTVRNRGASPYRLRLAAYFQMVLATQPEQSGPLRIRRDPALNAVFFENPRNSFRTGPAFVAVSQSAQVVATQRGHFFGARRGVAHPFLVEHGEPDRSSTDDRPVAAFLIPLTIPGDGETTVVTILGHADHHAEAQAVIRKLGELDAVRAALAETRAWWRTLTDAVRLQTDRPEFDRYLDWLKYQALAERIWARRGFYQSSGAFGFRDQLQDAVNLMWMDPSIARRQLLLHAAQQFVEGNVVHWFHRLQDGRTGFVGRTHASDNLLWLPWGVVEYLAATGDDTLLDETASYLESELPFPPLPANKDGLGFDPLRSARSDSVYRHCLKAIDLVLDQRMGAHGLPLMGAGDWNDGLDEIGSQGRGESVWLGFFLYYVLERMAEIVGRKDGRDRQEHYVGRLRQLAEALERTWRDDRYLRAINDDGIEIGVRGTGVWEIDALTAAWAVMAGIDPARGRTVFDTALGILEKDTTILLGWPPLREDTEPYLGRSSWYPEGVRENGMYCHGVQWLVGAARLLADRCEREGDADAARHYRETARRLWWKISPIPHTAPGEIETYGGQPNQQAADMVTTFDPGRMIWNGYTGAAGWMFRQALEGVLGLRLVGGQVVSPALTHADEMKLLSISRDVKGH